MRHSLFPSDESLPTWLHTTLLLLTVLPISVFLFWNGISAINTAHLEPLGGSELGQFFFGNVAIFGKAARMAGVSLILLSCAFIALAIQFSRLVYAGAVPRILPWVLVAAYVALSFWVKSLT